MAELPDKELITKVAKALWGEKRDWTGKIIPFEGPSDIWDGDRRMTIRDAEIAIKVMLGVPMISAARELLTVAESLENTIAGMNLPVPAMLKKHLRNAIAKAGGRA